jgi:hypothetical protein
MNTLDALQFSSEFSEQRNRFFSFSIFLDLCGALTVISNVD